MKVLYSVAIVFVMLFSNGASAEDVTLINQAKKANITRCLNAVEMASKFLLEKAPYFSSDITYNKANPNDRLISYFVSRGYSDGESHINIEFSPNFINSCDMIYTETFIINKPCAIVREETFNKWKYRITMNNKTLVLNNETGAVDAYLSPQGTAGDICLITKRETIYLDK